MESKPRRVTLVTNHGTNPVSIAVYVDGNLVDELWTHELDAYEMTLLLIDEGLVTDLYVNRYEVNVTDAKPSFPLKMDELGSALHPF